MTCNPNVILRTVRWNRAIITGLVGLSAAFFGLSSTLSSAAEKPPEPCQTEAYRAFDFWLGRWTVVLPDGERAGSNHIEASPDGCFLTESWVGAAGGAGFSMNFYEPGIDRWRQLWVSPGSLIEISGGLESGSMVLTGEIRYRRTGEARPFRGRWTPLADGRVRQFFEEKVDGKWQPWFEGFYAKVLE